MSIFVRDEKPVTAGLYFTRTPELVSRITQRVTGGIWSHVGLWFGYREGRRVRYEALVGSGFRGALPWDKLDTFARKGDGYAALVRTLDLWPTQVDALYRDTEDAVVNWGDAYGELQLVALWAWIRARNALARFGLDLRMKDDPSRVVCSEAASRLLAPYGIECRDTVYTTHDASTPVSVERATRGRVSRPDVWIMQGAG